MNREAIFTAPNLISLLRICLIPVVVSFLFSSNRLSSLLAALFFSIAAFTDWLDGYLARRKNVVTTLGKYLDPIADKLLVAVALIMLISLDRVESWIVMLIVGRELTVTSLRFMAATNGIVIESTQLGKIKTTLQIIATIFLILHYEYFSLDIQAMGKVFLWLALVATLWSGVDYFYRFFRRMKER
ncbi:MAG: CDP-diacylglycerol--glycerol-3-phosphate 3-phosphatidyltransferase [Proteobacteria bacterium]|nr:CDP-diacylglycerol--glycerol-3-phosphate 3-phosphatidyltransferase [Pseudomonadota bacterium]